tara:strand:+ start:939 stop:2003 length:1065 start_codon:yes stop_codon:yes gene_type:complete
MENDIEGDQIGEFLFKSSATKEDVKIVRKEDVQQLKNIIISEPKAAASSKRKMSSDNILSIDTTTQLKRSKTSANDYKNSKCSYCSQKFKGAVGVKMHMYHCSVKKKFNNKDQKKTLASVVKPKLQILLDENEELGKSNYALKQLNEELEKKLFNIMKSGNLIFNRQKQENKKLENENKEFIDELDYRQDIIQDKQNIIKEHQKTIQTLQKEIFKLKKKGNSISSGVQAEDLQSQVASSSQDTSISQLLIDVEKKIEQFSNEDHIFESPDATFTIETQVQYVKINYNKIHHEYTSLQRNCELLIEKKNKQQLKKSSLVSFTNCLISLNIVKQRKLHSILSKYKEEYSKLMKKIY